MTDVADDAVDVEIAGRHASRERCALVGELDHVAVLAHEDVVPPDAHRLGETCVRVHVSVFAVDRHEPFRLDDRQVGLQLVGLRVAGRVHVSDAGVDHLRASS